MKKSVRPILASILAMALVVALQGCLYTSHHFNSGRILEPGNTAITLGYGRLKIQSADCGGWNVQMIRSDSRGKVSCVESYQDSEGKTVLDTVEPNVSPLDLPRFSLGYRLGVRGPWGPFTGVELGWHVEAPTNPGSVEFDMKVGLPKRDSSRFSHSLSGGWIVGMWADNSYFAEYAASRAFGSAAKGHALYASYRITRLATQPDDIVGLDSLSTTFLHRRHLAHQASLGALLGLPAFPILPDFISPQATFTTPWIPVFDGVAPELPFLLNFNVGFGWRF